MKSYWNCIILSWCQECSSPVDDSSRGEESRGCVRAGRSWRTRNVTATSIHCSNCQEQQNRRRNLRQEKEIHNHTMIVHIIMHIYNILLPSRICEALYSCRVDNNNAINYIFFESASPSTTYVCARGKKRAAQGAARASYRPGETQGLSP